MIYPTGMANHYLCIQYAWALQFTVGATTNAAMCKPTACLEAFIAAMRLFYEITWDMWHPHFPTAPFAKPHMELSPCHHATQYFDGLLDAQEEAIQFENARRGMSVHDPIPSYKKDEKFLHDWNCGHGCGLTLPPKTVGLPTKPAAPASEAVGGQFADAEMRPIEGATASTAGMPAHHRAQSEVQLEPMDVQTSNTRYQVWHCANNVDRTAGQGEPEGRANPSSSTDSPHWTRHSTTKRETVDPLTVLLSSVPSEMGSIVVSEEEDWLLGEGDVVISKPSGKACPQLKLNSRRENPHRNKKMMWSSPLLMSETPMEDI